MTLGARTSEEKQGQDVDGVRRVLIVDDDAGMRMLCAVSLRAEGLHVFEAADGVVGLAQARSRAPDLILTDVMMPGLDGFELAEALRSDELTSRIPLIFLSGEAGTENAERSRMLGALAYVTKPIDPRSLASLVSRALVAARAGPDDLVAPTLAG